MEVSVVLSVVLCLLVSNGIAKQSCEGMCLWSVILALYINYILFVSFSMRELSSEI